MTMSLMTTAFVEGQIIPDVYTGDGEDISPPLTWTGVPEGTRELALICDDPDAPRQEPWVHWIVIGLSPEINRLEQGAADALPDGAANGVNTWGDNRYGGPAPPEGHGNHRYFFRLYAVDTELGLSEGATKEEVLAATEGHVLAKASLMGIYSR